MSKRIVVAIGLTGALTAVAHVAKPFAGYSQAPRALVGARCLHGADETRAERDRRDRALALAKAINTAQGQAVEQTKRYQSRAQLRNLPGTPAGFVVRLYSDGEGYVFSIKDDRDSCRYGIFSDQHGTLYESSPTVPQIAS